MDKTRVGDKGREGEALSRLIHAALPAAIYGLAGYLAGVCALPFGAYPFGAALLAAADRRAIFVLAGLLLSALVRFDGAAAATFAGVYLAVILLRVLIRLTIDFPYPKGEAKRTLGELVALLFCERRSSRVLVAALGAFFLSLSFLVGGGFLYYDLFGMIISVAIAPLAAYILCGFFEGERREKLDLRFEIGLLALLGIAAYGAAPLNIYGASVAVGGGMLVTLLLCVRRGFIRGLCASAVIGLAYSPAMTPIFLLCALSAGVFMKISATLASVSALALSLGYAFYLRGIYALDGTVGGIISGALLFSVISRISVERKSAPAAKREEKRTVCRALGESELDGVRLFDMNRRMAAISEALSRLSDLFEEMKLRFPRSEELCEIVKRGFECSCGGCPERPSCSENGSEVKRLAALLENKGFIAREDFLEGVLLRCARLPDIIDEINYNADARGKRSDEESELFSGESGYRALSGLIGRETEDIGEEYLPDAAESKRICSVLDRLGAGIVGVAVYGKKQKRVHVRGEDRHLLSERADEICRTLSHALSIRFERDGGVRRFGRGEGGSLELCEAKRYSLASVVKSASKQGEEFCGDCVSLFENSGGRAFSLISDGMGSGREAAAMSELTVGFMKNMLSVGRMNGDILQMLNSCLKSRCEGSAYECSATLDLMELDRVSGRAVFYKCGAAPSYIYRGGRLFKLRSRTMPLGILEHTDARVLDIELNGGDVVIMMSDGVTGGEEDCPYLFDLLRQNIETAGAERVADLILKYARSHSNDDATVAVLCVEEKIS